MSFPVIFDSIRRGGPLLYDDFSGLSISLDSHIPNIDKSHTGWDEALGNWALDGSGNVTNGTPVNNTPNAAYVNTGQADVRITVVVTTSATDAFAPGIAFRATNASNFLYVDIEKTTQKLRIAKYEAGAPSLLTQGNVTVANNTQYTLTVTVAGNQITAQLDGANDVTFSTSFNNTATRHGVEEYRDAVYKSNTFHSIAVDT